MAMSVIPNLPYQTPHGPSPLTSSLLMSCHRWLPSFYKLVTFYADLAPSMFTVQSERHDLYIQKRNFTTQLNWVPHMCLNSGLYCWWGYWGTLAIFLIGTLSLGAGIQFACFLPYIPCFLPQDKVLIRSPWCQVQADSAINAAVWGGDFLPWGHFAQFLTPREEGVRPVSGLALRESGEWSPSGGPALSINSPDWAASCPRPAGHICHHTARILSLLFMLAAKSRKSPLNI